MKAALAKLSTFTAKMCSLIKQAQTQGLGEQPDSSRNMDERELRHRHLTLCFIIENRQQKSVPQRAKCVRWGLSIENMARALAKAS